MGIYLDKFVHTETGKIIMSILLGFGLASLFRTVCKNNNCLVFHAAPLDNFKDKIYKNNDKCVKYIPIATKCSLNAKVVTFE
jgi:F0F1-type ATP synthase assembly protein I